MRSRDRCGRKTKIWSGVHQSRPIYSRVRKPSPPLRIIHPSRPSIIIGYSVQTRKWPRRLRKSEFDIFTYILIAEIQPHHSSV